MKQALLSLKDGNIELVDIPYPAPRPGYVTIANRASLVSAGTERMLVSFGRSNLLDKARDQPERVRQVLDKVRTDGLVTTVRAVQARLDEPLPLGYCSAGVVLEVGAGVTDLAPGDRVVSNGPHAEVITVPRNLCASIPDGPRVIADEEASFTVLGAIGLQGVRLAQPTLGEVFVVSGLGLIGILSAQILVANGCRVIATDFNPQRVELARSLGIDAFDLSGGADPIAAVMAATGNRGADGVIIAASTDSAEPIKQAAHMCRKRGRIVLVGVAALELDRADFYEKELSFQVSCSYGPGRYDSRYEEGGQDYPLGFVRWTAGRNFEAVAELMARGQLQVAPLISHRVPFQDATRAWTLLDDPANLGIVLEYPSADAAALRQQRTVSIRPQARAAGRPRVAVIGAGNYGARMMLPAIRKARGALAAIVSSRGLSAVLAGRAFDAELSTTDPQTAWADPSIDAVFIATRHDSHASLVLDALAAGKHIFVEKPLCISRDELARIEAAYDDLQARGQAPLLCVGFNRRFAPHVQRMKELLRSQREPKHIVITVNAGKLPADHWTLDPAVGGGRIVGEGCHFIDLARFLADSPIRRTTSASVRGRPDDASFILEHEDGSLASIQYISSGHRSFPKERIEVFVGERVLAIDNFRKLVGHGWPGLRRDLSFAQDKGHAGLIEAFLAAVRDGGQAPIGFDEIREVTAASFDAAGM